MLEKPRTRFILECRPCKRVKTVDSLLGAGQCPGCRKPMTFKGVAPKPTGGGGGGDSEIEADRPPAASARRAGKKDPSHS